MTNELELKDLTVIEIGENDAMHDATPEDFRASLITLIEKIRKLAPNSMSGPEDAGEFADEIIKRQGLKEL